MRGDFVVDFRRAVAIIMAILLIVAEAWAVPGESGYCYYKYRVEPITHHVVSSQLRCTSDAPTEEPPPPDFRCPPYQRGDMNCDCVVNENDIEGFVLALIDPPQYRLRYPTCYLEHADTNGDGRVDNGDIDSFVAMVRM